MIDKLGDIIDVNAYKKIPSKYHSALQSHGGWWSALSQLSIGESDTKTKLQRIDNLLLTIDQRTLIIIEDPDRGDVSETELRKERIQALMDRLRQYTSNRIKVILAGGMDILRDKDYRVAEYKEIITTPSDDFAQILQKITDEVWCSPEHNIILPNGKPSFTAGDIPNCTPRDFKHVIRDINTLWQADNLLGEIDLKTLITLAFASERVPTFGEYYRDFLEEVISEDYFAYGKLSRCLYKWGKRTSSTNMTTKEQYRLKSIELVKSEKKTKTELSKPDRMRSELDIRSSQELNKWIKRLNFIEGFQTIDQEGRVNYLQRFISREAKLQNISDSKISKLLPSEKLKDQDYFRSMQNLFTQLNTEKQLNTFDIERLLYTGQQSSYLYWRMRSGDIAQFADEERLLPIKSWITLANSIIEIMPNIKYTPNHYHHPAGFHLLEIVSTLESTRAKEQLGENALAAALDIIMRSVKSPCSAAGTLIWALFNTNEFSNILERQEAVWPIVRTAILNDHILPNDLKTENINWLFVEALQTTEHSQGNNAQTLFLLKFFNLVKNAETPEIGTPDSKALSKVLDTFNSLQDFGEMGFDYQNARPEHRAKWGINLSNRNQLIEELNTVLSIQ